MTTVDENAPPEQSMDDILASIRRIMLDEQARLKDGPQAGLSAESATHQSASAPFILPVIPVETTAIADTVLVLDDSMAVEAAPKPPVPVAVDVPAIDPAVDHALPVQHETGPTISDSVSGGARPAPVVTELTAQSIEEILAPAAAAAAAASVEALLRKLTEERNALVQPVSTSPTIEDFVRAELKPLLKSWLDENLPTMVERLVRAELARLTLRHSA